MSNKEIANEKLFASNEQPKDKFNLIAMIMLLIGVGCLLPWNVFITAKEYFEDYKLHTNISRNADYRLQFLNYVGFAAQIPSLLFTGMNAFYQPLGRSNGLPTLRVVISLVSQCIVLLLTLILAFVDSFEWPWEFFCITMVCVVVMNACSGVFTSIGYGLAAYLPQRYSAFLMTGTNLCGTFIAVLNIISKLFKPSSDDFASHWKLVASIYFGCTTLVMVLCLVAYFYLINSEFFSYHLARSMKNISEHSTDNNKKSNDDMEVFIDDNDEMMKLNDTDENHHMKDVPVVETVRIGGFRNCFALCCFASRDKAIPLCRGYWHKYGEAFRLCWVHYASVWSVMFCTLLIFPAIHSGIKPINEDVFTSDQWFTDITCFLMFNSLAMIGNIVAGYIQFPPPKWLFLPVWARTFFFVPFFLFCNFRPDKRVVAVLFRHDSFYLIGTIIFSFTSGYFCSLSMLNIRNGVPANLKDVASMVGAFFLVLGVISGVNMSYVFVKLVTV